MAELIEFKIHPQFIHQLLRSQAGTVGKAFSELDMNCIDAGAKWIKQWFDAKTFRIVDNGRGFESRQVIEDYFRTFGTPHVEGDAVFGRFRIGRGQIFVYARTVWRTRTFRMTVDLKNADNKAAFVLEEGLEDVEGCEITGEFYDPLDGWDQRNLREDLNRLLTYSPIDVYINDEKVSRSPEDDNIRWTLNDERMLVHYQDNLTGLSVYNQGIFVGQIPAARHGVSGLIITKLGHPLDVIMSRNEVRSDCKLMKAALAALKAEQKTRMAFSRNMSDAQRIAVYRQMTQENCDWFNDLKRLKLPIWKDATGGIHSLAAIKRLRIYKHGHRIPVIFSHELGQRDNADTIMQRGQAFVFDSDWIKTLEGSYSLPVRGKKDRITGALAVLRLNEPHGPLDWKDAKAIEENLETSKDIVPRSQLKAGQKRVLDLVEKIYHTCTSSLWSNTNPLNPLHGKLKIVGGRSKEDAGWTDGATYIAINVERYDKVVMQDLHKLVFLTLHELVHCALREESVTAHGHSIEFYKLYHDLTQDDYNVMHHCQYLMRKLEYESRKKVRDRRGLQMEPPPEPPAAGVLVEEAASV